MSSRKRSPDEPDREAPLRCSFCSKTQNDVRKLIAGPTVFICDECVEVCMDILTDDGYYGLDYRGVRPPVRPSIPLPACGPYFPCALCGMPTLADEALLIPERGSLCRACVDEVQAAAAGRTPDD
jgi:hypothetical protein